MASFAARSALRTLGGVAALGTFLALPRECQSQAEAPSAASGAEHLLAGIDEEQARNGPYSAQLIGPLTALSEYYRGAGDHRSATAADARALEVVRGHYGLSSLEQAAVLRRLIEDDAARGDFASAWDREQALLAIARKNPGDLRTIPIYRAVADGRLNILRRYLSGERPPEIRLGCYYHEENEPVSSCTAGSREIVVASLLQDAWKSYGDAINVFTERGLYSSDELRDLEVQILRSAYAYKGQTYRDHPDYLNLSYDTGRRRYERLLGYDALAREPSQAEAATTAEMADWDLVFGKYASALDTYEKAYALLRERNADESSITTLFSPEVPVVLPTFLPNPLASQEARSTGHIDVVFEIDRTGTSRHIQVVRTTRNASSEATQRLVRMIERSRFRLRLTNGEFAHSAPVALRYFVSE